MTLLEKMDRFVHRTYLDRFAFADPRPRPLRWIPLIALAAMAGGFVLMTAHEVPFDIYFMHGATVFILAFLSAILVRSFGPRLAATPLHQLDERELTVKARASAASGTIIAWLAMTGCFYMSVTDTFGWWRPRGAIDWLYLGLGLQGAALMLPTLIASWIEPRMFRDDED